MNAKRMQMQTTYSTLLKEFCESGSEDALYRASLLSQEFILVGMTPDELVGMHAEAVQEVVKPYDARGLVSTQQMLLEVMIAFGVRYGEYAEFRLAEARKAIDRERLQTEQASKTGEERLELLAAVSHELATPLTVAKGNVAAIRRFLAENNCLSHELSTRAIDAEAAIERLLRLREELLAASRKEVRELELAPLQVENAVRHAVKWAEQSAIDKSIDLSCDLKAPGVVINADPDALQSILGNLISNAIRYTPSGGSVVIRSFVELSDVAIAVKDTGIGITEEAKKRIFERFYRAPEAKVVATWGMGLGLAIANDLTHALGGRLTVEGAPEIGCTFTVYFPSCSNIIKDGA